MGRMGNALILAQTMVPFEPAMHATRLGGHLLVTALLIMSNVAIALAWTQRRALKRVLLPVVMAAVVVGGVLGYGARAKAGLEAQLHAARTVRVAAVAHDLGQHDLATLQDYEREDRRRHLQTVLDAYRPLVVQAAAAGAQLIVLPEAHVWVTGTTREAWLQETGAWARELDVWLVMGYMETGNAANLAVIMGPDGMVRSEYNKQHPTPFMESPRLHKMDPGQAEAFEGPLSVVICFDLDFADMNGAVAERGGLLAVPSNDWRQVEHYHQAMARWGVVQSGTAVVRATNRGTSQIIEASGRVLAEASSFAGEVVITADVPVTGPLKPAARRVDWTLPLAGLIVTGVFGRRVAGRLRVRAE